MNTFKARTFSIFGIWNPAGWDGIFLKNVDIYSRVHARLLQNANIELSWFISIRFVS